jgi:hypothetical protein
MYSRLHRNHRHRQSSGSVVMYSIQSFRPVMYSEAVINNAHVMATCRLPIMRSGFILVLQCV